MAPRASEIQRLNLNNYITIKLNEKNFLLWRMQVIATIRAYQLVKFIDESTQPPPRYRSSEAEAIDDENSEYTEFVQLDQLVLSWLLSTLTEDLITRFLHCETSCQLWNRVQRYFDSITKARARQLKNELHTIKKGNSSVSEYFLRIINLINPLVSIGEIITPEEHIEVILQGLPESYQSFVVSVSVTPERFSVSDTEALLLKHESRVEKSSVNFTNMVTAQSASSSQPQNVLQIIEHWMNLLRLDQNSTSRGEGGGRFVHSLVCQLCNKSGHSAYHCNHRFDYYYMPQP